MNKTRRTRGKSRTAKRGTHPRNRRQEKKSTPFRLRKLEKAIINVLERSPLEKYRTHEIAALINQPEDRYGELTAAIDALVERGAVRRVKGNQLKLNNRERDLQKGRLLLSAKGFGFLKPDDGSDDLFISPSSLRGARHNDLVTVEKNRRGRTSGRVIEIIERNRQPLIGVFVARNDGGIVVPDDPRDPGPVRVHARARLNAVDGDRVRVEILDSAGRSDGLNGRIIHVFGKADDPEARFKSLIMRFGFREAFSEKALREAEAIGSRVSGEDLEGRLDLRDHLVFTIDPESAHDFDDAVSLRRTANDTYELGVHIADVSYYIRPGSALDREAIARGTSVYTSHGTLPMLPERLSSDICSLREGVDRLTVSVIMTISPDGTVLDHTIRRSVIRSDRRFSYEEVQRELDLVRSGNGNELPAWKEDDIRTMILHLAALASAMRKRRFAAGGMDLDVPEFEIILDDDNHVSEIRKRPVLESHRIVEEFMLAANRSVTEFAVRKRGAGFKAFLYRVHASPDPERVDDFASFIRSIGLDWPFGSNPEVLPSTQLNMWLQGLRGHPLEETIRMHALRAMSKAEYSVENIGHYGLGFANYTHFTSPIRRYPDIVVHRLLLDYIAGKAKFGADTMDELRRIAQLSSERERAAQEMERSSQKIRQAEYFADQIGSIFEGRVSGVVPRGLFIELQDTGASGFIAMDDLGPVSLDREQHRFTNLVNGESWSPGMTVSVRVTAADPASGRIDLAFATGD